MKRIPRILMAIDGSERSFAASVYLGKMLSEQAEGVLLHVMAEAPEAFRDVSTDPLSEKRKLSAQCLEDPPGGDCTRIYDSSLRYINYFRFSQRSHIGEDPDHEIRCCQRHFKPIAAKRCYKVVTEELRNFPTPG